MRGCQTFAALPPVRWCSGGRRGAGSSGALPAIAPAKLQQRRAARQAVVKVPRRAGRRARVALVRSVDAALGRMQLLRVGRLEPLLRARGVPLAVLTERDPVIEFGDVLVLDRGCVDACALAAAVEAMLVPPSVPGDLVLGGRFSRVRAGSLAALVQVLTSRCDMEFFTTFLLTYRSFAAPALLLDLLLLRYTTAPSRNVRLKVVNVLRHWVIDHAHDFVSSPALAHKLGAFAAARRELLLARKLADGTANASKFASRAVKLPGCTPLDNSHNVTTYFDVCEVSPRRLAEQMTLIESRIYCSIQPRECLGQMWSRRDKETQAPSILEMIRRFNVLSSWVSTSVVMQRTAKRRARTIRTFVELAQHLLMLNNINGMMEIVSGLENTAVHRLRASWDKVPQKTMAMFRRLLAVSSPKQSYKGLRALQRTMEPPAVPFLGMFLTDLTFIDDGNPATVAGGLVNFDKQALLARAIREMQLYQVPYEARPDARLFNHLLAPVVLTEEALYQQSRAVEPKRGEDGDGRKRARRVSVSWSPRSRKKDKA